MVIKTREARQDSSLDEYNNGPNDGATEAAVRQQKFEVSVPSLAKQAAAAAAVSKRRCLFGVIPR